jgi:endonuclease/exonuclease/phosphatase family metal-dependent hydrolase
LLLSNCSFQTVQLKLASYNIHRCVGRDRRFDPERTVKVLQELDSDVVALQEVPPLNARGAEFLEYARAATGLKAVADPTLLYHSGYYGNVLLTRFPVRAVRRIDLSVGKREPRGAIDADLRCDNGTIQVIATHLGLLQSERRQQIKHLLGLVQDRIHPVALLGDINEWLAWGGPLRWLHAHFGNSPAPRTFPSAYPLFSLDRIWISLPAKIKSSQAHITALSRIASDHLPLKAWAEWR